MFGLCLNSIILKFQPVLFCSVLFVTVNFREVSPAVGKKVFRSVAGQKIAHMRYRKIF